jgi:hypothetical protein
VIRKPAVAVALLLLVAAGCGDSAVPVNSPSSPLGAGGDPGEECVPDPSAITMTNGFTVLENHSKGTVTVEQVSFYGSHHLDFIKAVIVPIRFNAIGMTAGWPPAKAALNEPGVQWDKRVPAVGARLPPDPAQGGNRNLVIAMRPTAHKGIAAGVQVRYRQNGHKYELRTHTKFVVVVAKSAIGRC